MNDCFIVEMSLFYETKDGNAKVERSATNFFPKNNFNHIGCLSPVSKKLLNPLDP